MEAEGDCSVVDSCLWCCDPSFMEGHLLEFLRGKWRLPSLPSRLHKLMAQSSSSSFPPSSSSSSCSSQLMEQAERDLCACFDCVEEYHRMVDSLVEGGNTHVRELAYKADVARITSHLQGIRDQQASGDPLSYVCMGRDLEMAEEGEEEDEEIEEDEESDDDERMEEEGDRERTKGRKKRKREDSFTFEQTQQYISTVRLGLTCSLREALKYPRLLLSRELGETLVESLLNALRANDLPEVEQKYGGIYVLLVHPEDEIRRWAINTVKSLGPINWDDYDDLHEVITWLVKVVVFDLFSYPVEDVGLAAWSGEVQLLPKHLFTHSCVKDFWLGLCMLITAMDAECMRSKVIDSTSDLRDIINSILGALEYRNTRRGVGASVAEESARSEFWPVLQCLNSVLERLGSCFWQFVSQSPELVFETVTTNPLFEHEMSHCSSTDGAAERNVSADMMDFCQEEDDISSSQLVYSWDCDRSEVEGRHQCAPHCHQLVALSWTIPFVQSLLDFGDEATEVVKSVLSKVNSIFLSSMEKLVECDDSSSHSSRQSQLLANSRLCNESLLVLSRLVDLLFSKEQFPLLLSLKPYWTTGIAQGVFFILMSVENDQSSTKPDSSIHVARLMNCLLSRSRSPKEADHTLQKLFNVYSSPSNSFVSDRGLKRMLKHSWPHDIKVSKIKSFIEDVLDSILSASGEAFEVGTAIGDDAGEAFELRLDCEEPDDMTFPYTALGASEREGSRSPIKLTLSSSESDISGEFIEKEGVSRPRKEEDKLFIDVLSIDSDSSIPPSPPSTHTDRRHEDKQVNVVSSQRFESEVDELFDMSSQITSLLSTPGEVMEREASITQVSLSCGEEEGEQEEEEDQTTSAVMMVARGASGGGDLIEDLFSPAYDDDDLTDQLFGGFASGEQIDEEFGIGVVHQSGGSDNNGSDFDDDESDLPSDSKPTISGLESKGGLVSFTSEGGGRKEQVSSFGDTRGDASLSSSSSLVKAKSSFVATAKVSSVPTVSLQTPHPLSKEMKRFHIKVKKITKETISKQDSHDPYKCSSDATSCSSVSPMEQKDTVHGTAAAVESTVEPMLQNPKQTTTVKPKLHVQSTTDSVAEQSSSLPSLPTPITSTSQERVHVQACVRKSAIASVEKTTTVKRSVHTAPSTCAVLPADSAAKKGGLAFQDESKKKEKKKGEAKSLLPARKTPSNKPKVPSYDAAVKCFQQGQAPTGTKPSTCSKTVALSSYRIPKRKSSASDSDQSEEQPPASSDKLPKDRTCSHPTSGITERCSSTGQRRGSTGHTCIGSTERLQRQSLEQNQSKPSGRRSDYQHQQKPSDLDRKSPREETLSLHPSNQQTSSSSSSSSSTNVEQSSDRPGLTSSTRPRLQRRQGLVAGGGGERNVGQPPSGSRIEPSSSPSSYSHHTHQCASADARKGDHTHHHALADPHVQKGYRQPQASVLHTASGDGQKIVHTHHQAAVYTKQHTGPALAANAGQRERPSSSPAVAPYRQQLPSNEEKHSGLSPSECPSTSPFVDVSLPYRQHLPSNEEKLSGLSPSESAADVSLPYRRQLPSNEDTPVTCKSFKQLESSSRLPYEEQQPTGEPSGLVRTDPSRCKTLASPAKSVNFQTPELKLSRATKKVLDKQLAAPSPVVVEHHSVVNDPRLEKQKQAHRITMRDLKFRHDPRLNPDPRFSQFYEQEEQQPHQLNQHTPSSLHPSSFHPSSSSSLHPSSSSQYCENVITKPRCHLKMSDLQKCVLSWDPCRFLFPQQKENGEAVAPVLESCASASRVPLHFSSYNEYVRCFKPLLLLEIWDTLYHDLRDKSILKPPDVECQIEQIPCANEDGFHTLTCTCDLSQRAFNDYAHPVERDLVICQFSSFASTGDGRRRMGENNTASHYCFGVVESYKRSVLDPTAPTTPTQTDSSKRLGQQQKQQHKQQQPQPQVQRPQDRQKFRLKLQLKVAKLLSSFVSPKRCKVKLKVVTNLAGFMRQWNGLINLHTNGLVRDILCPRGGVYFAAAAAAPTTNRQSSNAKLGQCYNLSQLEAITSSAEAVNAEFLHPRICMIQGPPGTGKTHTILGLIQAIFEEFKNKSSTVGKCQPLPGRRFHGNTNNNGSVKKPHVLVCAQSNAGIDEITRRILVLSKPRAGSASAGGNRRPLGSSSNEEEGEEGEGGKAPMSSWRINMVRVGQVDKMAEDVRCISLDRLALKDIRKGKGSNAAKPLEMLKNQITKTEEGIRTLEKQLRLTAAGQSKEKMESDLKEMQEKRIRYIKEHREERKRQSENTKNDNLARKRLIMNADIICSTLVGSGSTSLDCLRGNPFHFTCVIVDEAAQCSELDALIPLTYQSTKLVLVGDPMQLASTVRSQRAQELGMGQSLFERISRWFSMNTKRVSPVKLLNVQYRMLPEISKFPSQYFYNGLLKDCRPARRMKCVLKPFLLFNVVSGKERSHSSGKLVNAEESRVLIELCKVLLKHVGKEEIGIISPYRAQANSIKAELRRHKWDEIEVGTVDGYQGREKNIIILSCVRAKNRNESIGFLAERKRMNVALTRARHALYVVCHLESLELNDDWNKLIEHARNEDSIVLVQDAHNSAQYAEKILQEQCGVSCDDQTSSHDSQVQACGSHPSCCEQSQTRSRKRMREPLPSDDAANRRKRRNTCSSSNHLVQASSHGTSTSPNSTVSVNSIQPVTTTHDILKDIPVIKHSAAQQHSIHVPTLNLATSHECSISTTITVPMAQQYLSTSAAQENPSTSTAVKAKEHLSLSPNHSTTQNMLLESASSHSTTVTATLEHSRVSIALLSGDASTSNTTAITDKSTVLLPAAPQVGSTGVCDSEQDYRTKLDVQSRHGGEKHRVAYRSSLDIHEHRMSKPLTMISSSSPASSAVDQQPKNKKKDLTMWRKKLDKSGQYSRKKSK